MGEYTATIGLEVHAQLATRTKMFCACKTQFGAAPNSLVCPVCLGLPGALPVLNGRALELGLVAANAFGSTVQRKTKFDRKNYFYPDLPKGYQISQHDEPSALGGEVRFDIDGKEKCVHLTRIHLEEDAGKSMHEGGATLVDLNRCGTPLLEIVSEPEIKTPEEAHAYLAAMKETLKYAKVSECNMEQGNFRIDTNISIRPKDADKLGTRTEIKNLNSFRAVEAALRYEIERQSGVLDANGRIVQETLAFDAATGRTSSMRSKEEAHDYRYFPEPDLLPFVIEKKWIEKAKGSLPELPRALRKRFTKDFGLNAYDAGVLTAEREIAEYFQGMVKAGAPPKAATNIIKNHVLTALHEKKLSMTDFKKEHAPEKWTPLATALDKKELTQKMARELFAATLEAPSEGIDGLIRKKGFSKLSDESELSAMLDKAIAANEKAVNDLKKGKKKAKYALIGFVMRKTRGKADPEVLGRLLKNRFPDIKL